MSAAERKMSSPGSDGSALPRSIFIPQVDPRKDMRETVDSVLSDKFMAFLSVLLIPIILLPFFFVPSPDVLSFFSICDVTIILFFVVEYLSKLYLAKSRWEYFKSPWHLVDLTVVMLSFVSYLPFLGLQSKGSTALLLRLIRLPRAFAVGGRTAGSRVRTTEEEQVVVEKEPEVVIRHVGADLANERDGLTWEEMESRLATPEQEWFDIHNISENGILRLSAMLRVPPHAFKSAQVDELYPRIDTLQRMTLIFLQSGKLRYPEVEGHYLTIAREGEVVISRGPKVISASPHGTDMFRKAMTVAQSELSKHSFAASVLYGILDSTIKEYRSLFSEIEVEVTRISGTPRSKLPRDFLARMYELNKQVVHTVSNLVHFKEIIKLIISGRVPLEGLDDSAVDDFQDLLDETDFLNDIADDIVERVRTIIELYINQASFETNRVLKILAVITALAIIPSAVGGLLGMNLLDMPYQFRLWQVLLGVGISMAFVSYCFIKLGWLRS